MPPRRFPHAHVLDDPQIEPPYTDLAVTQIDTQPNHDTRQLYVSAVIANLGNGPPSGPFCVHTVVLTAVNAIEKWDEEWRWYQVLTFPFRTLATNAQLYYVEEGGDMYQISVTVDSTQALFDRSRQNNSKFMVCPPFVKPNFNADSKQPLRRETSIENGKRTSKLTIAGKPLK